MKYLIRSLFLVLWLGTGACKTTPVTKTIPDNGQIEVVFVQVNDVYEIEPLAGGKEGGMARVATLKKQYLKQNPNTFLVMAGDFLSPSVYNSLPHQGKAIRGRQMVEAMNAAGMDIVVFGNHEFDIKESELQDRLNESEFKWVASNAFHKVQNQVIPFARTSVSNASPFPRSLVLTVKDADGTTAKIGIIGLTLPFNQANYVSYTNALTTAKELYRNLKDSVDAVVAITHQTIREDMELAREVPGLALILGGHEHDQRQEKIGNVFITKAHANAKSAYVVKLNINQKLKTVTSQPELKYLNETVALDSATHQVVQKWAAIAGNNYRTIGFDASKVILSKGEPLDGRESELRNRPTNLTRLITASVARAAPQAEVVLFNSGSIRVDDILPMPVTQYDIIRTLPFGGGITEVQMKGSLLEKVLIQGHKNVGSGGYLLYNESVFFNPNTNKWQVNNQPLNLNKIYRVALTDYLFTGQEANLGFLNPDNPDVIKVFPRNPSVSNPQSDIRLAIVQYLQQKP